MRRMTYFVMALALVLGLSQCKKEQPATPQNEGNGVMITLNVGGNNNGGAKVNVDPDAENQVTFEDGDQILVASGGSYVGTLTRDGGVFAGTITDPTEGQRLYFYFLGNKQGTLETGATSCTVNISDQTTEAGLPVISMGKSTVAYSSDVTSYTSRLYNKCSLMKFVVTTPSTAAICITGMNNEVTVDFGDPTDAGFTYDKEGDGLIKMPAKDAQGVTWAIVLPRSTVLPEGEDGSAYSEDGSYIGKRPEIHVIEANKYYDGGIAMTVNTQVWNGNLAELTGSEPAGFATARDGMTVYGTLSANVKVSIAAGATVTLDGVTINGVDNLSYQWAGITCEGDATINLEGTNIVKGFAPSYPGVFIPKNFTLTIDGTGSLNASSNGNAAGIGGDYYGYCGNITINGGVITATGGPNAAGIGGAFDCECGDILIQGGTVTATAGKNAAGIGCGGGEDATCGIITIENTVTLVTAVRGNGATYSIGEGKEGMCGTVTIGGTVYPDGAMPNQSDGATYIYPEPTPAEQIVDLSTITSAYTAIDGDILTGTLGVGMQVSIADGATITLRSANINKDGNLSGTFHGIQCLGDATIILENNDNYVKASKGSSGGKAGIFVPRYKTLTIQSGNSNGRLVVDGAGEAAGIGGYSGQHCGAIVINSGKVTATAGDDIDEFMYEGGSAGIGSSAGKRCGGITIHTGQIFATGAAGAAGIGTGALGICKQEGDSQEGTMPAITINISSYDDGWVKAYKGEGATYFIGGGTSSKCGTVTVGNTTYVDGSGLRGITSETPLDEYVYTVIGNSLVYMP